MMCLLISGCGLFKKTVKTSNSVENTSKIDVKSESSGQIKTTEQTSAAVKLNTKIDDSSKTNKQIRKDVDENTQVSADNIEIAPDGNIKASGNAKYIRKKRDQSEGSFNKFKIGSQVIAKDSSATKTTVLDSKSNIKNSEKQLSVEKTKSSQTTSTPDFSWIVGIVIAVVMVVGGIMFGRWLVKKLSPLN